MFATTAASATPAGSEAPASFTTLARPAEPSGLASQASGQATLAHGARRATPATLAPRAEAHGDERVDATCARPVEADVEAAVLRLPERDAGLDNAVDDAPATNAGIVDPMAPPTLGAPPRAPAARTTPTDPAVPAYAALDRQRTSALEPGSIEASRADRHEVRATATQGREAATNDATPAEAIASGVDDAATAPAPAAPAGVRSPTTDVVTATAAPTPSSSAAPAVVGNDTPAVIAGAEAASSAAPSTAPPAEARLPHPPQSPAFAAALGQQVSLWIRRGVQQAVLQLNPAELGPVAIHIALDGARAHVDFTAPHAATRAALEGSLPVLASALRDSGLTLAGGGVFDRPREQADGQGQAPSWAAPARGEDAARRDALPPPVALHRRGVVDLVA